MRLFRVTLSIPVVVWASDEASAMDVAREQSQSDMRMADPSEPAPILTPDDIPAKWDTGSLPWGREDDATIGELLGVRRALNPD